MSDGGQTKQQPSGWTTDTLKQHMDSLFQKLDQRLDERFTAQQVATEAAFKNLTQRFEGVNEWRQTVTDILNKNIPREEAEQATQSILEKMEMMQKTMDIRMRTMEQWSANIQGRLVTLASIWGLVVVLFSILVNYALRTVFT